VINREFLKAGHLPTLLSAFLYFDMSFMVWVLLGALGVQISADLGLSPAQKGFMVALPVLAGALLRVVFGVLVDKLGPRRAGIIGQCIVITGLVSAWLMKIDSYQGSPRAGIHRSIKGSPSASRVPATPAPCSRHCSRRASRKPSAGTPCSASP
jgi:NNP family nitrate/nitrite transporter-like MFS transporter